MKNNLFKRSWIFSVLFLISCSGAQPLACENMQWLPQEIADFNLASFELNEEPEWGLNVAENKRKAVGTLSSCKIKYESEPGVLAFELRVNQVSEARFENVRELVVQELDNLEAITDRELERVVELDYEYVRETYENPEELSDIFAYGTYFIPETGTFIQVMGFNSSKTGGMILPDIKMFMEALRENSVEVF